MIHNEMNEFFLETVKIFNHGYQQIRKDNPELTVIQVSKLTEIWWNGVMTMLNKEKKDAT